MKQISKVLLVMLLLSSVFSGCKKDDKDDQLTSYFKVNGKTYELSAGLIEYYGEDPDWHEGYNVDLYLHSPGLLISDDEEDFLEGKGHVIFFEMFSVVPRTLAAGVYEYVTEEPIPVESFDFGAFVIGLDAQTEVGDVEREIVGGTVTVNKEGAMYIISFECTDNAGNSVSGHYEGVLDFYDFSSFEMAAQSISVSNKKSILR